LAAFDASIDNTIDKVYYSRDYYSGEYFSRDVTVEGITVGDFQ
jgi:hypothetical protein